jgi:hypothetical protein
MKTRFKDFKLGDKIQLKPGVTLGYNHPAGLTGEINGFGYSGGPCVNIRWDNWPQQSSVRPDEIRVEDVILRLSALTEETP